MHAILPIFCLLSTLQHAQSWIATTATHHSKHLSSATTRDGDASEPLIVVAATREQGKNDQLMKGIHELNLNPVELPCIAHADGPDFPSLQGILQENHWKYVTITSPEAARVLASAWKHCTWENHPPAVVAVGKATEDSLKKAGIDVAFCPSKATAEVLVQELPMPSSAAEPRVLYPASVRAQTTLQDGLTNRGFTVVRLNTYDTVTAHWNEQEQKIAATVQIACFASPSAVKGWLLNHNNNDNVVLAACIGETSAKACREKGWKEEHIFYPEKPGMTGWVDAVADAAASLVTAHV